MSDLPGSRLQFRGPLPDFDHAFIAVLGGSETFGRYVTDPYPARLAEWLGVGVANLGVAQAGLSLFSEEKVLLDLASQAEVTVLQLPGPQNMSNRFYGVHSRRNDRFLGAAADLRTLFPNVDFSQINFTGHLLETLRAASTIGFEAVVEELRWAWVQRMRRVLSIIRGRVVLLWLAPVDRIAPPLPDGGEAWHFIDQTMIDGLDVDPAAVVTVPMAPGQSLDGMVYPPGERDAARVLPGPVEHTRIAEALLPVLAGLLERPARSERPARAAGQSFSTSSGTAVKRSATRP